ncbi:purine-cytosine permease [Apodospora peruviana]|uniref:Purine-cytosine permease n=1 Tax=Apodospora peruviana TaxID=516989 RepID=A0AAE0IQR8_9PEZI|nr:purine-cytosine permease [Apodospora peruviana]
MGTFIPPINEKNPEDLQEVAMYPSEAGRLSSSIDENAVHKSEFSAGDSLYARMQRFAGRFGVEERGIERVPSDERTDSGLSKIGTMWLSANMVVSTFAVGAISVTIFGLGFVDAALTLLFINLLGILPVCFFSTFGPRFGLRQMVLSRFYFGYYGVKVAAALNVVICLGWSSVNVIVGAQLFHAINSNMPGWAGILLISVLTMVICIFGYKVVHVYERWSWIPCFVIFLIVIGEFAHSGNFDSLLPLKTGTSEAGAVLSYSASVFGFAAGWCVYAADYTVYQPVSSPRMSVFLWTFGGLFFPLVFCELLGAAIATATVTNLDFQSAYEESGIGGLFATVLVPPLGRFGEFCVVILALSITANNCPNIYSVSLSLQVLAHKTQRVPRFLWTFIGTCIYVAISVPGYDHFASWLENFMLIIGYWLAIYEGVALSEHFVFKRGFSGYRPEDYTNPKALPPGFAATAAVGFGVMGAALGMAQVWYTGPIARLAGTESGVDIGFELAFGFTVISYVIMRTLEKSYFHR